MANSYIRDLSSMAGDQSLSLNNQTTDASSYSKFSLALMQLLKQQQSLGTQQFVNAEQQGIQAQAGRVMAQTPQSLIGANPALQAGVRSAQAGAMEPTIQGAAKMGKTFSEQIAGLGNAIEQSRAIGSMMQEEEATKRQQAIDMIYKFPTAVKTLDDKTKKTLAQQAGVPIDFIDALPDTTSETKTQVVEVGNRKLLINSQTGATIKDLGSSGAGLGEESVYSTETARRTVQSVDGLLGRINNSVVGIMGLLSSRVPGTKAYDFKADLETLKSNIAFRELTAMREASKTGGALGQVSDREGVLLQSALGSLDIGQSQENFRKNLEKIKDSINRWTEAVKSSGQTNKQTSDTPQEDWVYIQ